MERQQTATVNEQAVWDFLLSKLENPYGTAGLMGNLYAESGLIANNLQNTYNSKLGYTDSEYTDDVDSGAYTKFASDSAGYGLAQWTYKTRKANLLEYAQSINSSVGNLDTQLEFLWIELQESYQSLLTTLKSTTDVQSASNAVLLQFEKPADQSDSVKEKRYRYGLVYFNLYANDTVASSTVSSTTPTTASVLSAGKTIQLSNTPLYASSTANTVSTTKSGTYYIWSDTILNNRIRITNSASNVGVSGQATGWIDLSDIETTAVSYTVKVTVDTLNIRSGAGTDNPIVGTITDKGTYTIVEESTGEGATLWGKLKSGLGWIALDYTTKT